MMANSFLNSFGGGYNLGAGIAQRGADSRRQSRLSELASQSYTTPAGQQNALLGQMAQVSPQFAQQQQQQFQEQGDARSRKAAGAAKYVLSAVDRGDQAAIQGAYRTVYPFLSELVVEGGGQAPPEQWDPVMAEGLHQLLAAAQGQQVGSGTPAQLQTFNAMSQGLTPEEQERARRIQLGLDPRASSAAIGYKVVEGADGKPRLVALDPREAGAQVMGVGGSQQAPQGTPQGSGMTQFTDSNGRPINFDEGVPTHFRDQVLANPEPFDAAPSGSTANLPQSFSAGSQAPNPFVGRAPEEQAALTESAKLSAQLGALPARLRLEVEAELEKARGKESVAAGAKLAEDDREKSNTLSQYEVAMSGVMEGLGRSNTGPVIGRLPAFTTDQQIAEGGVAAIAPVLKQLFRSAGEGIFTDKDQELLMQMIPTRIDTPGSIEWKLDNIDKIVRAKLNAAPQQPGQGRTSDRRRALLDKY